jgi:hypothetical protein
MTETNGRVPLQTSAELVRTYKSLAELRAAYMPDAARAVSGIPRADPGGKVTPEWRDASPLSGQPVRKALINSEEHLTWQVYHAQP